MTQEAIVLEMYPPGHPMAGEQHQEFDDRRDRRDANIALAAAKEAVRQYNNEVFGLIGYDLADKRDIRKLRAVMDFATALHNDKELKDDIEFARKLRVNSGRISMAFILALVAIAAGAVGIAIWEGIKALVRQA